MVVEALVQLYVNKLDEFVIPFLAGEDLRADTMETEKIKAKEYVKV